MAIGLFICVVASLELPPPDKVLVRTVALKWDWLVKDKTKENRFTAECMLVISSILHLGTREAHHQG